MTSFLDCADNATFFDLMFGAHNVRLNSTDEPTRVEMRSTEYTIHPNWGSVLIRNDVALIKLPQPIAFNGAQLSSVNPILICETP